MNKNDKMGTAIPMDQLEAMCKNPEFVYSSGDDDGTVSIDEYNRIIMDIIDSNISSILNTHPDVRDTIADILNKEYAKADQKRKMVIESAAQCINIHLNTDDTNSVEDEFEEDEFEEDGSEYDRLSYVTRKIIEEFTPDNITDERRKDLLIMLTADMVIAINDGDGDTMSIINKICKDYNITLNANVVDDAVDYYRKNRQPNDCCDGCNGQNGDCMCLSTDYHNRTMMNIIERNIERVMNSNRPFRELLCDIIRDELEIADERTTAVILEVAKNLGVEVDMENGYVKIKLGSKPTPFVTPDHKLDFEKCKKYANTEKNNMDKDVEADFIIDYLKNFVDFLTAELVSRDKQLDKLEAKVKKLKKKLRKSK